MISEPSVSHFSIVRVSICSRPGEPYLLLDCILSRKIHSGVCVCFRETIRGNILGKAIVIAYRLLSSVRPGDGLVKRFPANSPGCLRSGRHGNTASADTKQRTRRMRHCVASNPSDTASQARWFLRAEAIPAIGRRRAIEHCKFLTKVDAIPE